MAYSPYGTTDARPTRPRPSRALRRTLIGLLVLVVLLVVTDRVGNYVAEQTAASRIQESQGLPNEPDVDIGGFPFLTQIAGGEFDRITVTATDVPVGNGGVDLTLSRLQVTLDQVSFRRDFSSVHADSARAVGVVGYAQLSQKLGVALSYAGDGRVRATKSITVLGRTITPTVTAEPELVGGELSFGKAQVDGLGTLGGQVSAVLGQVFDVRAPLRDIPFDVDVRKLSVDADGLRIDLVGKDLNYSK